MPNPTRIYHSLGNAVSPPVVAAIGASILRALEHPADGGPILPGPFVESQTCLPMNRLADIPIQ